MRYPVTPSGLDLSSDLISLHALGSPEVRDPIGAPLAALNRQPKRLALLAFLAVGRPDGCRRDTLLGLFWPELPEARARNALRQALAVLRGVLGPDAITGTRDGAVAVSSRHVRTDVEGFERRLADGAVSEALALYRGDFLEGLHVEGCTELDRWIEEERNRLRQRAALAARHAAGRAELEGRTAEAAAFAARAVSIAPYEEEHWRDRIALLGRLGRRAEALQCFEDLRALLARELGVEPDPETVRLAERLRQAVLPAQSGREPPPPSPRDEELPPAASVGAGAAPTAPRRLRHWLVVGVCGGLLIVAFWRPHRSPPLRLDPGMVVIEPLAVHASDTTLLVIADALAGVVALRFTGEGGPRAVDPAEVDARWRRDSARTLPATLERAKSLGAGRALRATLVESRNHLILSGALLGVPDGAVLAEAAAEGSSDSLLAVMDQFVNQVLGRHGGASEDFLQDLVTHTPAALRAYLAGQHAYRRGHYREAVRNFDTALDHDSAFALAAVHAVMASFWGAPARGGELQVARAHRERLPPGLRAVVEMFDESHDWRSGYEHWMAGVAALPRESFVWQRLGDQLYHEGAFVDGVDARSRSRDALERAAALDSSLSMPLIHLVDWAARSGDTAAVIRLGRRYLQLDANGEEADFIRWRLATGGRLGEEVGPTLDRLGAASLREILGTAVLDGQGLDSLPHLVALARSYVMTLPVTQREPVLAQMYFVALDRGRADEAADLADEIRQVERTVARREGGGAEPVLGWYIEVLAALFGDGDSASAARALRPLAGAAAAPPARDSAGRMMQGYAASALALWYAHTLQGDSARLWEARAEAIAGWPQPRLGQATITTSLAIARARPGDPAGIQRLDSVVRRGPLGNLMTEAASALRLSDLRASTGDLRGARDALLRRRYYQLLPVYTSAFLRREREIDAALGDIASSRRVASHLAALTNDDASLAKAGRP